MKNRRVFSRILCVLLALSIVLQQADLSGFTGIFGGGTVVAEATDSDGNSYTLLPYDTVTLGTSTNTGNTYWYISGGSGSGTITYTSSSTGGQGGQGGPGNPGNPGGQTYTYTLTATSPGTIEVAYVSGNSTTYVIYGVLNADGSDPGVGVYVYVAAKDSSGNAYSDEMLELLGIGQLDGNSYFPAGEITLSIYFFAGKTTPSALITSTGDYTTSTSSSYTTSIISALKDMDTSGMKNQTINNIYYEFESNIGNNVPNYAENIVQDTNQVAGSQCTALFSWSGNGGSATNPQTSQGFADSRVAYHLDVRFETVTVTYKYGNNDITSGTAKDGETIVSKAFIKGATLSYTPTISVDGYMVAGYYTDYNFTYGSEWDVSGEEITENTIVYVKLAQDPIELVVEKEWSDYNNIYGKQPSSVGVTLYDNGSYKNYATLSDISWTHTFTGLTTASTSSIYTIVEDAVNGYTATYNDTWDTTGYTYTWTVTNTLDVGYLTIEKIVNDPDEEADTSTFTFEVSGFDDDATGVLDENGEEIKSGVTMSNGTATITVEEGSSVTLMVPVGEYTVTETSTTVVDGSGNSHTWTASSASETVDIESGEKEIVTITNTITGDAEVTINKNWDDASNAYSTRPANNGSDYTVTLAATNATDGKTYSYTTSSAWSENTNTWTTTLTVPMYDSNGKKLTYTVTESGTNLSNYYTLSDGSTGSVTPSESTTVSLTNTLNTGTVTVQKVVQNSDGNTASDNSDTFSFTLSTADGVTIGSEQSVAAGNTITFSNVPLNVALSLVESVTDSRASHSYTTTATVGGATATVNDGGYDSTTGTKTSTISFTATDSTTAVVVTNKEQSVSVDLSSILKGTKTLTGADTTKTFSYTVTDTTYNTAIATGTTTVSSGNTVDITWEYTGGSTITLDEVGTYTYVIKEDTGTAGGVSYDTAYYTLTITVTKDTSSGELVATASMTKTTDGTTTTNVTSDTNNYTSFTVGTVSGTGTSSDTFTAAFTNEYTVTSTTLDLSGTKTLTGRAIADGEFSVQIEQLADVQL